ncbi:MAG: LPS assembly lipoprotein LptE [Chitinophagaceae bacterium]
MIKKRSAYVMLASLLFLAIGSCKLYSFKDVSIPAEVKTVKVNYLDNKARYVNPQLSPQLSDRLRQKINNQTRLTQVQGDDAHFEISGWVTDYSVTTSGISNQQAASNRLNVSVHIILKNRLDDSKSFEADVSRNFDFSATLSLDQAQAQLTGTIIQNLTDEIFNRIFSNW